MVSPGPILPPKAVPLALLPNGQPSSVSQEPASCLKPVYQDILPIGPQVSPHR